MFDLTAPIFYNSVCHHVIDLDELSGHLPSRCPVCGCLGFWRAADELYEDETVTDNDKQKENADNEPPGIFEHH